MNDSYLWTTIERAYRNSGASVRGLANLYHVPEATIRLRAEREGWQRDVKPFRMAEAQAAANGSDITPLDYMLAVMRDEGQPMARRAAAAVAAAPYCHSKKGG
jgi:hypothetical protein